MKNRKGFTLVELLAVIVILALVMVLAIPAVFTTLETAKRKTFFEYFENVYSTAKSKWMTDKSLGKGVFKGPGLYVYNIRTDLGAQNGGKFGGYVIVSAYESGDDIKSDFYLYLWSEDYFVGVAPEYEGTPDYDTKVSDEAFCHPWNKKDELFLLNSEEVQNEWFSGIDFDNFTDKEVACFIQHYWIPYGGEEDGKTDYIYFRDGYETKTRTSVNYSSEEERTAALLSCVA